jgi:putative transposase
MRLSYKYRLYPNKEQIEALQKNFNFCRFLYNSALEERKSHYKKHCKGITYYEQNAELPEIKKLFPEQTKTIFSQTLQGALKQLDCAYKNFFRRVELGEEPGYPRFKPEDRFRSICFPQSDLKGFGVKLVENNRLKIFGIPGEVKIKLHRPFEGICKQVRIVKQSDKYYVVISCNKVSEKPLNPTGKTVGIDLGLMNFVTLDDGTKFHHPKPYKTSKEKLAYYQRKLDCSKKGSNNRKKIKKIFLKVNEKVSNIRDDFQHKLANNLIRNYDKIIIEKLNIQEMLKAKGFEVNKANITDASWGSFCQKLIYKAESAGRSIIQVDPRNTSKTCSKCGKINDKLTLRDRKFCCGECGFTMDRDQNAAINIKKAGNPPDDNLNVI